MAYRDASCSFCADSAKTVCPRCGARLCDAHGPPSRSRQHRWCSVCEKERDYEVELAAAEQTLAKPEMPGADASKSEEDGYLVDLIVSAVTRPFRRARAQRRAEQIFAQRTPIEIEAWRAAHRGFGE